MLTKDVIKELIPKIGPRLVFTKHFKILKQVIGTLILQTFSAFRGNDGRKQLACLHVHFWEPVLNSSA